MDSYDVAVVGAGLAGLQCARLLGRKGLRVLLADQKSQVSDGIHTTGIFVRKTLEDYPLPSSCLGPAVDRVVLYSPNGRALELTARHPEFRVGNMKRLYDTFLGEARSTGVEWAPEHRFSYCDPLGAGSVLRFATERGARHVRSRFVIGADGARSKVARDLHLSVNRRFIIGAEDVYYGLAGGRTTSPPSFHCFLDPQLAPGYVAWLVDDGDAVHIGVGGYAERFNPGAALQELAARMERRFDLDLAGAESVERRAGRIPIQGVLPRIANHRGLLVGDAAGAVSPLTAGGLDACMRLSDHAAQVTAAHIELPAAPMGPLPALATYDGEALRARFVSRRFMRHLFGQLRHPALLEATFSLLSTPPFDFVARHVFFGRGSFPAIEPALAWDRQIA